MTVLRTPSRSSSVSGSNRGWGCPGTGMVRDEKGIVRSTSLGTCALVGGALRLGARSGAVKTDPIPAYRLSL
jgi:hypothetical protein